MTLPANKDRRYMKSKVVVQKPHGVGDWNKCFLFRHLKEICEVPDDKISDLFISLEGDCYSISNGELIKKTVLIPTKINSDYPSISIKRSLQGQMVRSRMLLHRMIGLAFLSKPSSQHCQVAHRNADRLDWSIENIRWVTPKENMEDFKRFSHPTKPGRKKGSGRIVSDIDIANMRILQNLGMSCRKIAKVYGIGNTTVSKYLMRDGN